jgi:hypothetical protein
MGENCGNLGQVLESPPSPPCACQGSESHQRDASPSPELDSRCGDLEPRNITASCSPKVKFRIYDHALLVLVHAILAQGTFIDGSSWFLQALNKVWKSEPLYHTNNDGGKKTDAEPDKAGKHSKEGQLYNHAFRWSTIDEKALRSDG